MWTQTSVHRAGSARLFSCIWKQASAQCGQISVKMLSSSASFQPSALPKAQQVGEVPGKSLLTGRCSWLSAVGLWGSSSAEDPWLMASKQTYPSHTHPFLTSFHLEFHHFHNEFSLIILFVGNHGFFGCFFFFILNLLLIISSCLWFFSCKA